MIDRFAYFVFALGAALLLALHRSGVATPAAYSADGTLGLGWLALGTGLVAGAVVARRVAAPARSLSITLALASLLCSGQGYLCWISFDQGAWLSAVTLGSAFTVALLVAAAATLAVRGYGAIVLELGVARRWLNPLRAALFGALLFALLSCFPSLGLLRSGALVGALVAGLTLLVPSVNHAFELGGAEARRLVPGGVAAVGALAAMAGAGPLVPLADVALHGGDVLFVLDERRGRHVVTRVQRRPALFSNDVLVTNGTDARRFAEALAHPALAAARIAARDATPPRRGPARVLVFSGGTGAIEREVLRHPSVQRVISVVPHRRLSEIVENSAVLRALGDARVYSDPRVVRLESEAAPFVAASRVHYDVILADFGDPTSPIAGKHYTRHFLASLRDRLAPGGYLALQITSPLRTPAAHQSVLATLRAAGFHVEPYRAPLPTLGEWGFALAATHPPGRTAIERLRNAELPSDTTLVSGATLVDLFAAPPEPKPVGPSVVNYLHDQPVVSLYLDEEQRLWH